MRRFLIRIQKIEETEGHVLGIVRQDLRRPRTSFLCVSFLQNTGPEIAQRHGSPLTYHFFTDLMDGRQNPADSARRAFVRHGAISDGEMGFFLEAIAIYFQRDVFHPCSRAALKRCADERLKDVPYFAPALPDGLSQKLRMF